MSMIIDFNLGLLCLINIYRAIQSLSHLRSWFNTKIFWFSTNYKRYYLCINQNFFLTLENNPIKLIKSPSQYHVYNGHGLLTIYVCWKALRYLLLLLKSTKLILITYNIIYMLNNCLSDYSILRHFYNFSYHYNVMYYSFCIKQASDCYPHENSAMVRYSEEQLRGLKFEFY